MMPASALQRGGLARSVRADETQNRACWQFEAQSADCQRLAISLVIIGKVRITAGNSPGPGKYRKALILGFL